MLSLFFCSPTPLVAVCHAALYRQLAAVHRSQGILWSLALWLALEPPLLFALTWCCRLEGPLWSGSLNVALPALFMLRNLLFGGDPARLRKNAVFKASITTDFNLLTLIEEFIAKSSIENIKENYGHSKIDNKKKKKKKNKTENNDQIIKTRLEFTTLGKGCPINQINLDQVELINEGIHPKRRKLLRPYHKEGSWLQLVTCNGDHVTSVFFRSQEEADFWRTTFNEMIVRKQKQETQNFYDQMFTDYSSPVTPTSPTSPSSCSSGDIDSSCQREIGVTDLVTLMNRSATLPCLDDAYARQCGYLATTENATSGKLHSILSIQKSVDNKKDKKENEVQTLSKEQFHKFMKIALDRPEFQKIYNSLLEKESSPYYLSVHGLVDFMKNNLFWTPDQSLLNDKSMKNINIDVFEIRKAITKFEPFLSNNSYISDIGFQNIMMSSHANIRNSICDRIYHDMSLPLNDYFIASSHNTYLVKYQFKGESSSEMYRKALERGCRCVELDCHDGEKLPIIYHGPFSMTTKVPFREVVQVINEFAFKTSQYPVILSIENHCSVQQQSIMADDMIQVFGDKLLRKQITENENNLPSPEQLKNKIIIKYKKINRDDHDGSEESLTGEDSEEDECDIQDESQEEDCKEEETGPLLSPESLVSSEDISEFNIPSNGAALQRRLTRASRNLKNIRKEYRKNKSKSKKVKISSDLSNLVVYCQAKSFKSFQDAIDSNTYSEMSSFGEKKARRISRDESKSMMSYNTRHLSRIYPGGERIISTNLDPVPMWNMGSQLVAMNYQTDCQKMQLNQAMFADNGGCGYVLKPLPLRTESEISNEEKLHIILLVKSATQIPFLNDNNRQYDRKLLLKLRVFGAGDTVKFEHKSKATKGVTTRWDCPFAFSVIRGKVSFVHFSILTDRNNTSQLAQYTIRVDNLKEGPRTMMLKDSYSRDMKFASLFVDVGFK